MPVSILDGLIDKGDVMEILKWMLMIVGIFVLLLLGCYFLLKSEEQKRKDNRHLKEVNRKLNQVNQQLDDALIELESYNDLLKLFSQQVTNIKDNFLNKKS